MISATDTTKTPFTLSELRSMGPCPDALEYATKYKNDFALGWEKCERPDWMIWFLRRKDLFPKPAAVKFAIICARHVLSIYENKYPKDNRPRKAIEAAEKWIGQPTEENRLAAYAAYAAAAAAAYAAYAAAAADAYAAYAYAAYAAAAAADAYAAYAAADAYAAYAAAAAYAAYAAAAAAAKRTTERKWQANQLRKLVKNPFK